MNNNDQFLIFLNIQYQEPSANVGKLNSKYCTYNVELVRFRVCGSQGILHRLRPDLIISADKKRHRMVQSSNTALVFRILWQLCKEYTVTCWFWLLRNHSCRPSLVDSLASSRRFPDSDSQLTNGPSGPVAAPARAPLHVHWIHARYPRHAPAGTRHTDRWPVPPLSINSLPGLGPYLLL